MAGDKPLFIASLGGSAFDSLQQDDLFEIVEPRGGDLTRTQAGQESLVAPTGFVRVEETAEFEAQISGSVFGPSDRESNELFKHQRLREIEEFLRNR